MGQGRRDHVAEVYCAFHQAVAKLRDEAEARRRRYDEAEANRYGLKAERAGAMEQEAGWIVGRLESVLGTFAPERMGVPPWTA
jgi:hypothetical protein